MSALFVTAYHPCKNPPTVSIPKGNLDFKELDTLGIDRLQDKINMVRELFAG
jgi:hypothetical protein